MSTGNTRSRPGPALGGLVLVLWLCLPAVLVQLDQTAPSRIMENLSILTSQETWMRVCAGEADSWVVPSWNGQPRVNKPPLLVWINLLAWADLTPETADLTRLVWRARLVGLLFAALTLAATFWAGCLIGGRSLATLGALITGTGLLFIRQARSATYDTHMLGWLTLAVAAGLWAMQLDAARRVSWRSVTGWALTGMALGAAVLTKGPLALMLGLGPLATMALLSARHRRSNLMGAGAAALVALAVALPWYLHILQRMPHAVHLLATEYRAERDQFNPPWYYLGLIGLVFPWSFALLRACLRWSQREFRPTDRRVLAWGWFFFVFLILSLPAAKQQRYIVPALPALGLIIADAWLAGAPAYRARWQLRLERLLTALHWMVLGAAAVVLALFLLLQDRLIAAHILPRAELVGLASWLGLVLLPLLVVLGGLGWRWQRAGRQVEAAWTSAAIMVLIATVAWYGYAPAPAQRFKCQQDIMRAHEQVGGQPFYFLDLQRPADHPLSKEFLMYTRRLVPVLDSTALARKIASGGSFFVATRMAGSNDVDLITAGLSVALEFRDGDKLPLRLFHREGTNVPPSTIGHAVP